MKRTIAVLAVCCLLPTLAAQEHLIPSTSGAASGFMGFYVKRMQPYPHTYNIYAQFTLGGPSYQVQGYRDLHLPNPPTGWQHDDTGSDNWAPQSANSPNANDSFVTVGYVSPASTTYPGAGWPQGFNTPMISPAGIWGGPGWYNISPWSSEGIMNPTTGRVLLGRFAFNNAQDVVAVDSWQPFVKIDFSAGPAVVSITGTGHFRFTTPPAAPCNPNAGACLQQIGVASPGQLLTVQLSTPGLADQPCWVLANHNLYHYPGGFPVVAVGGTTFFGHLQIDQFLLPLADPYGFYGPSFTHPYTDANGTWAFISWLPNNPGLVGLTMFAEAFVGDPFSSSSVFMQSNVLTVSVQ